MAAYRPGLDGVYFLCAEPNTFTCDVIAPVDLDVEPTANKCVCCLLYHKYAV